MSVESLIQAGQKGYANIHDNDFYFSDSNFKEIGENEELTKFFMNQVDPDGSKYGGDVEKAKTGFLNDYTFKSNSIWGEVKGAVQSVNYSEEEKQQKNFLQRMYDTAPNRLTGGDGVGGAAQALGYGLAGGLVGEDGVDLGINIASTAASSWLGAKMGAAAGTAVAPGAGTVVGGALGAITGGALALFGKNMAIKGTQQLGKEGLKELLKQTATKEGKDALVKQVAKEYGWNTAKAEFAVNGVLGGVGGAAEEYKNENIGLSEGNFTDYLTSAGGGALMAGGIGGALGYVTSRFGEGRRLGKELVQDTRDGQKIMSAIGDDGPRTYREAIEQRLKDIEEKEKPTQDEIVQKQQLEAEKKLYDKYRIPLTEEQRQGVNDLCSDLSIQLRQEANELDTFPSTSGHSPEKLRAVADMLDNLLDFNSAEKAVVDAEKALVGGGDDARANLARVKAKWSALRSIGKYLNDNKLGERDSVYSLLDDATFMDFAKNLDDNVKNAIIAENKRIYPEAGLRPGEELQPQTPVTQPKATQAQGKTKPQPDIKANRKKADKAIKDNQSGKSAAKIIEELKQEAQANPEESALATMTPDEIQGLQPTLEDVIGGMPKEQASTITQMSQSSVKPDGTPSQVSKSFLDALKSIPEDEGQFNQLVANLSQQSGLPAEQIAPALKAAKQSYATKVTELEGKLADLKATNQQILETLKQKVSEGTDTTEAVSAPVESTPPKKTHEQISREAKKKRDELHAEAEMTKADKDETVKRLSQSVSKTREVFASKEAEVTGLIQDGMSIEDFKGTVPERLQPLIEGVTDMATARTVIKENAQRLADYSILSSINDVVGSENLVLFKNFLPLFGDDKDAVRLAKRLDNVVADIHAKALNEADGENFNSALTSAINNSLLPLKGARKGRINPALEAAKWLPEKVDDKVKAKVESLAKRVARSCENNAQFKKLPEESQNSIKVHLIQKRVQDYLANRAQYEGVKDSVAQDIQKAFKDVEALKGQKFGSMQEAMSAITSAEERYRYVQSENYMKSKLDDFFNKYQEPANLAPHQKEEGGKPVYDEKGNLIDIEKKKGVVDEKGNAVYETRYKQVNLNTSSSRYTLRKNFDQVKANVLSSASNRKARKDTIAVARSLNPEAVASLERKTAVVKADNAPTLMGLDDKGRPVLLKDANKGKKDRIAEIEQLLRIQKPLEGEARTQAEARVKEIDARIEEINKLHGRDRDPYRVELDDIRAEKEEVVKHLAVQQATSDLVVKSLINELKTLKAPDVKKISSAGITEKAAEGIILEGMFDRILAMREKQILDRLVKNMIDGTEDLDEQAFEEIGRKFWNTKFTDIDKATLKETARKHFEHNKEIADIRKSIEQYTDKEKLTNADKQILARIVEGMNRMLREQHDVVMEIRERGAKNAVPSVSDTVQPKAKAQDIVLDEKTGKLLIFGKEYGSFIKDESGRIVVTNQAGNTLTPAENLEKLMGRKNFQKILKKAENEKARETSKGESKKAKSAKKESTLSEEVKEVKPAVTAKEVMDEIKADAIDEIHEKEAVKQAEAERTLADSASTFTSEDLDRKIGDYYDLVTTDQFITARIKRADGSVTWKNIWLNSTNEDATMRTALGNYQKQIDLGDVTIMGCPLRGGRKKGIDSSWLSQKAFYLTKDKRGQIDPNYIADKAADGSLEVRKNAIKDSIGNDDALIHLKAMDYPLEENELKSVFFTGENGKEINGLDFVNSFEQQALQISISRDMTRDAFSQEVARLALMAKMINEKLPYGYRKDNSSRILSASELVKRMKGLNQSEKISVQRALQQLNRDLAANSSPYFFSGTKRTPSGFGYVRERINKWGKKGDKILLPNGNEGVQWSPAVSHELLHWGFTNLLTPDEKIQFLETCAKKYFNEDGTLNTKLAVKIGGSEDAVFKPDGSLDLAELFAYEGTGYYGDRLTKQAAQANDSFWDMLVTKFKDLMSWIQGMRNDISPENIELFEKILPSEYNSNRYEAGVLYDLTAKERVAVSTLDSKTNKGVHGLNIMNNLEKVRADAFRAMFDPSMSLLDRAEAMKSVAGYLKGVIHGSRTEIGSEYIAKIRGKIIGYAEQISYAEGNKLIESKLKTNNLFIKGKKDNRQFGTVLEVYQDRYKSLGYSDEEAKRLAEGSVIDDVLDKTERGDALYSDDLLFDDVGEDAGYRATNTQSPDADTRSLSPERLAEINEQAEKETLEEANKWLKENNLPEVHSDNELSAAFEAGNIPREEMVDFMDFYETRLEELKGTAQAELVNKTEEGAPRGNSTAIQKTLGRLYDIIVDAEDSVITTMKKNGYALAPNERHRPSVAPKEEKFTPPSKPSGPKTPEVNVVKESVEAKALLGETNGIPNLASPKIKAVLDSILEMSDPEVKSAVRKVLFRYSEFLGKDDLTYKDLANLLGIELPEYLNEDRLVNASASFLDSDSGRFADRDFYSRATSTLHTMGKQLTQGEESEAYKTFSANLYLSLSDGMNMDVLEDGTKYIFDVGSTPRISRDSYKARLLNLPENILDGMREFLKTDDLKKAFADIDFEKGTEGAFFTIDGKKVPVGDVVQTVYSNLAPEPTTVKAYTPITGAMDTAIDNGYAQNTSSAAVQIAALSKGCTPAQAEVTAGLIPTRIRNWWGDSVFKKALTSMDNGLSLVLSSNTKRCKDLGANFLAETGRFFYEDKSRFIGKHYNKLQTALRELRGSEVKGRSNLRNQIGNDFEDMKRSLLTNNHLGIVTENERGVIDFMRTATNDNWQKKWDNLNEVQRNAVTELTNQFEAIRKEMVDLGIQVNDYRGMNGILHYLPQRFNKDWVTNNHDKFMEGMTKFFVSEGKSQRDAVNVAESLYSHIANDFEFSGFSGTDPKFARKSGEGLYARVLNIKPEQWKEFGLTDMFDNNLEALARDYIDHAATLIERTKRWGVEGHGRAAYFSVQAGGLDGAANVLMHSQEAQKQSGDNARLNSALEVNLFGPLTTNHEEAKKIAESIERALNDGVSVDNIVNTLVQLYAANRGAGLVHFQREMNCLVNGIKDFGLSVGPDAKIPQKHAKYLVQASDLLTGMRGAPKDDSAVIGWMTSLNNMTMLSMATIASLSDVGLIGVRSGEVMPFLKGIKATMKQMAGGDQAERDAIRSLGVQFETDRMNNFLNNNNGRIQGMNNAFFKATGLTQWTAFSRQMSANVGFEAIKCFQRQAREAIASGNQNSLTYRKAMYWLRTLGLNDPEFINGRALTSYADMIEACKADPSLESMNEKVARAVVKFVNQSAFAPNRADIPAWAQSGFGRLVFQFKSYPLMLGRLTKWALDSARLKNGANIKPLVLLATLGVGMGAGGQALRDVISGRNIDYEDDDQSFADMHSVKQRLASEICRQLGWESWADNLEGTQADSIIGWYASGLMGLGALGVIGDFAFNLTESTQDGAYGELNVAKQLFGPSFGTAMDAYHVAKTGYNMTTEGLGIKSERPSNKDERRAFSVLESRIPVVGGFRSLGRELKDYLVPLEEN